MILSCSEDDETRGKGIYPAEVIGQWKLIYFQSQSWDSYMHDFTNENIEYDFKPTGILVVEGGGQHAIPHTDGPHDYLFRKASVDRQHEKRLMVKIDSQEWWYSFSDGEMMISQADRDGGMLVFIRE